MDTHSGYNSDNTKPNNFHFSLNEGEQALEYMLDGFSVLELIYNNSREAIDYRFLKVNNAFKNFSGLTPEEIEGRIGSEIAPFTKATLSKLNNSSGSGIPLHFEYYNINSDKFFNISCFWQSKNKFAGVFRDITKQKNLESQIKELKEHYRTLIDGLPEKIFMKDSNSNYISCNVSFSKDFDVSPEKVFNKSDFDLFSHELAEKYIAEDKEVIKVNKQHVFSESYSINGITKTVQTTKTPIPDRDGKIIGIIGVSRDVTEEARSHIALKESERKYRSLVDNAPEAIFILDLNKNCEIIDANRKMESLCGMPKNEICGKTFESISPIKQPEGDFSASLLKFYFLAAKSHKKIVFEWDVLNFSNNTQTPCEVRLVLLESPDKDLFRGSIIDLSERKDLEYKLKHSEKLQTIGQLAGGIAHDFNNQLSGIMGYAELLMKLLEDETLKEFVQGIITSSERAANLTRQLLSFTRKDTTSTSLVDIHKVLVEVVSLLSHSIDKRIKITQHFKATEATIKGDATQLQNAILNIGLNARDAMPSGGDLIFETEIVFLDKDYCTRNANGIAPGNYIKINISDTGYGINKETCEHIFEPFFTTKNKGTGMGLASASTAIINHKGSINVYSEVGHGSVFRVFLPTTEAPLSEEVKTVKDLPVNGENILLVDDEAIIRKLATQMLKDLGYSVTTCSNGYDAIEYYSTNWNDIDLVILDMIMPKINGSDTYKALKTINPEIKAILSSGYSMNEEAFEIMKQGVMDFIEKPYRQNQLANKIYKVLNIIQS